MSLSSAKASSPSAAGLDVRPFRALTYRRRDPDFLARVSSPAYDLVTPAGRSRLVDADPHNVVRLILPRVDAAPVSETLHLSADPIGRSAQLAEATLRAWRADGVLQQDDAPGLWLYELAPADGTPPTVGWLGAVGLPPADSTAVLPHEDTYPVAVEGRRALLAATRTDLEPIVLAHDPEPAVAALVERARRGRPTIGVVDSDGVRHRLWQVTEPAMLDEVRAALARTRAVIADGHHRFAAARAHHSACPDVTGSDAILALVTSSGAGGLRVEAIHRVIPDLPLDGAVAAAARGFSVEEIPVSAGADLAGTARTWLHRAPAQTFLLSDGRRLVALSRATVDTLAAVPAEAPPAWRSLDVVLAHHGLIDRLWRVTDEPASLLIAHAVRPALQMAADRSGTALLLRAPTPGDVAAVARAGARMPRKSTLFVPKPRTGLVLRPLGD